MELTPPLQSPVTPLQDHPASGSAPETASHETALPVVLLGGNANALSIVRNLGRHGIDVTVSVPESYAALKSRYCRRTLPIPSGASPKEFWEEILLQQHHPDLRGSLLLALDDHAVEFLAERQPQLRADYRLDDSVPEIHLAMLDKLKTLKLATKAGIPTPGYCDVRDLEDLERVRAELQFPVVIKPVHAHLSRRHFPQIKVVIANAWEDLHRPVKAFLDRGLEIIVCEMIPGPDSLLSSYYTYHDADGHPLFHYTKRILRRHRLNCGKATYHISEWLPETAEAGQNFFRAIGFRGLGNVEFKRDPRDQQLKIIECNPRFTDAHELLVRCGLDTSLMIYRHLTNRPIDQVDPYRRPRRLIFPLYDLIAFHRLRKSKKLSTAAWLKSLAFRLDFPFFRINDPLPFFAEGIRTFKEQLRKQEL